MLSTDMLAPLLRLNVTAAARVSWPVTESDPPWIIHGLLEPLAVIGAEIVLVPADWATKPPRAMALPVML